MILADEFLRNLRETPFQFHGNEDNLLCHHPDSLIEFVCEGFPIRLYR